MSLLDKQEKQFKLWHYNGCKPYSYESLIYSNRILRHSIRAVILYICNSLTPWLFKLNCIAQIYILKIGDNYFRIIGKAQKNTGHIFWEILKTIIGKNYRCKPTERGKWVAPWMVKKKLKRKYEILLYNSH